MMADKNPFGEYDLTITIPLQNWGEIEDLAEYTKMLGLALVEGECDHRMEFHAQMITHGLLNRLAKALSMQIEKKAYAEFGTEDVVPTYGRDGKENGDRARWLVETEKRQKKADPPWLRGMPTVEITKYEGPLR
jgi:hypothetical protein